MAQASAGTAPPHEALPHVPACVPLGLRTWRSNGAVHVAVDADGRWESPLAPAVPGLAALVCDAATGFAVALLDEEIVISTALLTVELLATPPAGEISAVARVEADRGAVLADGHGSYAAATAVLRDHCGQEFGRAMSWWARRPRQAVAPRPAPTEARAGATGGDSLSRTLGLESATHDGDGVGFRLAAVGDLRNRYDTLHGGVGALLAHHAAVAAPMMPEVLSLGTHYHRAAGTDVGPVQVRGSRIRRGRTSAVAVGEVLAADGRPAPTTTVTMALTQGPRQ